MVCFGPHGLAMLWHDGTLQGGPAPPVGVVLQVALSDLGVKALQIHIA